MKKLLCRLFGHNWKPFNGDFFDPYCVRCGNRPGFIQILKDAFGRKS